MVSWDDKCPDDWEHVYIVNPHGGLCLDAKKRRERAGKVHMWPCQQDACQDANEQCWKWATEGLCEGEGNAWMMENCMKSCRHCEGLNKNQHWDWQMSGDGVLKSHDGICLDASSSENGGQVWMWPCNANSLNQKWHYDEHTKQIMNGHGSCLDARERRTVGGKVHMWKCSPHEKNQRWELKKSEDGFAYYKSKMDYSKNIKEYRYWWGDYVGFNSMAVDSTAEQIDELWWNAR